MEYLNLFLWSFVFIVLVYYFYLCYQVRKLRMQILEVKKAKRKLRYYNW